MQQISALDFLLEVRSQGQGGKGFTMVGVTGWTTRLSTGGKVTGTGWEGVYYGRGDRVDKRSSDKALNRETSYWR